MTAGLLVALALLLAGCAGDGPGNDDTLLTGASGFLIVVILVWVFLHYARKGGRS